MIDQTLEPRVTLTKFGTEDRVTIRTDRWGNGAMFSMDDARQIYSELSALMSQPAPPPGELELDLEPIKARIDEAKKRQDVNDSGLLAVLAASDFPRMISEITSLRSHSSAERIAGHAGDFPRDADGEISDGAIYAMIADMDFSKRLATERIAGRKEGLEMAAKVIDDNAIADGHEGPYLMPRRQGTIDSLAYASAIRSLDPTKEA